MSHRIEFEDKNLTMNHLSHTSCSAVGQSNSAGASQFLGNSLRAPADWKSAIQQVGTLRYSLRFLLCLTLFFFALSEAPAQFGPGGFGGFQGGGGANANRSRNTATRTYSAPGSVGDAVISIDPETRSLIVIADEKTREYISQVVSNLDKPKPQVLIKVVFVEVTHNKASDIGIEGAYRQNIGDPIVTGFMTNFSVINAGTSNASIVPSSITPITSSLSASNIFGLGNAGSPAGLYQIFNQDYQVTLRAIAQTGQAKVLSRPSVIARNNQ